MGIRCYCPNGHRLNLKAFLAGHVGVCPHCQERFRIPTESEPKRDGAGASSSGSIPASDNGASNPEIIPQPQTIDPQAITPHPSPTQQAIPQEAPAQQITPQQAPIRPVDPQQATGGPQQFPAMGAPVSPVSTDISNAVGHSTAPPAQPGNPIDEAPHLVWYVRPPSGGEFGPANGDIMSRWLAEGRVTPDTLVWREGWDDWQRANLVFPSL